MTAEQSLRSQVRAAWEASEISQADIARELGVSTKHLSYDNCQPKVDEWLKIKNQATMTSIWGAARSASAAAGTANGCTTRLGISAFIMHAGGSSKSSGCWSNTPTSSGSTLRTS